MIQCTPEWFEARRGKITSSILGDITKKLKGGGYSKERENQLLRIVAELLTGEVADEVKAKALEWGKTYEPKARSMYEVVSGNLVQEVGFVQHPDIAYFGGSPDGLVGGDGMIEIKCPFSSVVHLQTLLAGKMPEEHMAQVQGNLWAANRQWLDFVSFDARFPVPQQIFVQRIPRNEVYIAALDAEVKAFWAEAQTIIEKLGGGRPVAVEGSPAVAV
jgi:putative phage-type endonuclease